MRERLIHWLGLFVIAGSSVFAGMVDSVLAQVALPTPIVGDLDPTRGPQEEIRQLDIQEGLKQFLLASLYVRHSRYEQAIEILEAQLVREKDAEIKEVLNYLHRTVKRMIAQVEKLQPTVSEIELLRGAEEEIQNLSVREGLKQYLRADFYAACGKYDEALNILDQQLAKENDSEVTRLLEYLRRTIRSFPPATPAPSVIQEKIARQADAKVTKAEIYIEYKKPSKAIRNLLEALKLYQQIENIEGQRKVCYQLTWLYNAQQNTADACRYARQFIELLPQDREPDAHDKELRQLLEELGCSNPAE